MKRLGASSGKDSIIKESSFLYLILGLFLLIFLLSFKPAPSNLNIGSMTPVCDKNSPNKN